MVISCSKNIEELTSSTAAVLAALLLLVLVAVADVFRPRPRPREVEGEAAAEVAAEVVALETRELVRRVLVLAPNVTTSSTTVETLLVEAPPLAPRAPAADEPRLPRAMVMMERDNLKEINGD